MLGLHDLEADQQNCIAFINSGEDSLIAADVGTGKTVISLTAAEHALIEGFVTRWLVLAPLLVATDTWAKEFGEWAHLRDIRFAIACGDEDQRVAAIESDAKVVVMNYENLQWLLERYPRPRSGKPDPLPFDGLICDEIDKLKEVSSKRFKAFRERVKIFNKRIGLTGTLIPNRLTEVWGQAYMVDGGQSFGRSFYKWRQEFFYPTDYNQRKWAPFPLTRDTIISRLSDLAHVLRARNLPEVVPVTPHMMTLDTETAQKYRALEDGFFLTIDDEKKRTRVIDAANTAVLGGKLQQICSGFSYVPPLKCTKCGGEPYKVEKGSGYKCRACKKVCKQDAVWHSNERILWLHNLAQSLGDQQLLVFYHFKEERDALLRVHPNLPTIGGGVSNVKARKHITDWNENRIKLLALHPASAGHGLNLQKSGAHHIAFLTLPWSGGLYKQVVGRLARRGQVAKQIFVHTALFRDTIDEDVFGAVTGKLDGMEDFLDDLELATAA